MIEPRKGEKPTSNCIRTARFFETDEGWFLQTREGIQVGPYPSSFDAELASSLLISRLAQLDPDEAPAQAIHSFLRDPAYGPRPKQVICVPADSNGTQSDDRSSVPVAIQRPRPGRANGKAVAGKIIQSLRALSGSLATRR